MAKKAKKLSRKKKKVVQSDKNTKKIQTSKTKPFCFISLPHEFGAMRKALVDAVKSIGGDSYHITISEADTLRKEIKRGIEKSSILIADISSTRFKANHPEKGPRPTVMWEIGYAEANGLGLILLCQVKDEKYIPSMLSGDHIIRYDINNITPMIKNFEETLENLNARGQTTDSKIFRSTCFVDRSSSDLEVRYLRACDTIKILELNLETVADQVPIIKRALQKNEDLSIQILTLNPFSGWAEDRANQLAELKLRYRRNLVKKIQETHDGLIDVNPDRWGLRIYDTFPTQIMFQIDNSLIHSIIALGKRSRNMLHFEVQKESPNASDTFEAHFAQLWSLSVDYKNWLKQNEEDVNKLFKSDSKIA